MKLAYIYLFPETYDLNIPNDIDLIIFKQAPTTFVPLQKLRKSHPDAIIRSIAPIRESWQDNYAISPLRDIPGVFKSSVTPKGVLKLKLDKKELKIDTNLSNPQFEVFEI